MRSRARIAIALALLAALGSVSCSDSTSPGTAVGVYTLASVNGTAPPVILDQDVTGTLEVTSGQVSLNSDGTFSDITDFRVTDASTGGVTTSQDVTTGTYTITGSTVTLSPSFDTPYSMVWDANLLTQVEGSITLIYRR